MSIQKNTLKVLNIKENIFKFSGKSNFYLIKKDKIILVDTGHRDDKMFIKESIEKIIPLNKIDMIIMTHLHYDHCGNLDLFPKIKIYASKTEINDFYNNPDGTVLNNVEKNYLEKINLIPILNEYPFLKIIPTPGHTKGSICIFLEHENVLFTGDTFFRDGLFGRTDLPTSHPIQMETSLRIMQKYKSSIICPGHDY
jgi:hydroxyacylglutathione hydrolase